MDETAATVEAEVAMLLRLAGRPTQPASGLEGSLDRSAYLILGLLLAERSESVNAIADHLRLDASTVTRQVIALETAGHVTRRRCADDGRSTIVEPTPAGLAALDATRAARSVVYDDVLADWSHTDRQALATLLARLNAALDDRARKVSAGAARQPAPLGDA
ncbi:MAG: MarR family winged helix-turn-helix transcriptional regulator [Cellulomonas sp.]